MTHTTYFDLSQTFTTKTFVLLSGAHSDTSWFVPGGEGNAQLEAFLDQFKP